MAEQDGGGFVAYRNTSTNEIHVLEGRAPDLEARPNFERVNLDQVPADALDEARRERQARQSIAASADIKKVRTEVTGEEAARAAGASATGDAGGSVVVSTDAPPARRIGAGSPDGVLSRPGVDDVQIGPNPELHPKGQAALRAQARLDADYPQNVGVLARQHATGDPASEAVPDEAREKGAEIAGTVPNTGPQADSPTSGDAAGGTVTPAKKTAARKATGAKATGAKADSGTKADSGSDAGDGSADSGTNTTGSTS